MVCLSLSTGGLLLLISSTNLQERALTHFLEFLGINGLGILNVILILGLEEFNEVMIKGLVPLLDMNTLLGLGIDHSKIEFIRVAEGSLGFEHREGLGFFVKVLGSENVVLVFFEESPFRSVRWLRSLLVRLALDSISNLLF
jgi:hypothetical protein